MSDSPEEVLAPTSPQGLGVPINPVVEKVSSIVDPDPVKETHREEQKEAIKKPTMTGMARCPAWTGSASAAPASGLLPRRTGTTSLSRPPRRSTVGIKGPSALLAILQQVGPFLDRLTVLSTILQLLARERLPAIASPAANAIRSPEKKETASSSSSSTSPTPDRRSSAGSTASTASIVRRAATSTTTPTASSHR